MTMGQQHRGAVPLPHRLMWLLVASTGLCFADDRPWDYSEEHGPSRWPDTWSVCGAKRQSPINIDQSNALHKDLGSLQLTGYDTETSGHNLFNNGHTVQLSVASGVDLKITGGELPATYKLAQFHFHWGSDDTKGSEHTVDGKAYPLEIHFVHHDTSVVGVKEALNRPNGLAVLGVFAKIGDKPNEGLNKLLEKFNETDYKGKSATINQFTMKSILPSNTKDFARYSGSLTTPPCSEVVVWTVFKEPITVTSEQMRMFRELNKNEQRSGQVEKLVDNFRFVQDLHDRTVYLMDKSSAKTINNGHLRMSVVGCLAMLAWASLTRY